MIGITEWRRAERDTPEASSKSCGANGSQASVDWCASCFPSTLLNVRTMGLHVTRPLSFG